MRLTSITSSLLAAMLVAAPALAQEDRPVSRPTIAVVAFDTTRTGWMPPPGFGETVADLLTDRLVSGGAFRIIDTSLVVLPGDDVGRMPAAMLMERATTAGVHYLVLGAVTRLSMEHRTSTGGGVVPIPIVGGLIKKKKTDSILRLTIRMVGCAYRRDHHHHHGRGQFLRQHIVRRRCGRICPPAIHRGQTFVGHRHSGWSARQRRWPGGGRRC